MKSIGLLFAGLFISMLCFSQIQPKANLVIKDDTTQFKINIPIGFTIFNSANNKYYACKSPCVSTLTLTTGSANFEWINKVYEPLISKSTGFLKWNGSSWNWDTSTYSTDIHSNISALNSLTSANGANTGDNAPNSLYSGLVTMTYPGAGIPLSTGLAWGTSITNNSANWNTAYGWGNHASAGYAPASGSGNYIWNQNASAQTANSWISGRGVFNSGIEWGFGSYISGKSQLYNSATNGTQMTTKTGSIYDFQFTNGDGSGVMSNPTGTQNILFDSEVISGKNGTGYGAFRVSRTFTTLNRHSFDDYSTLDPSSGDLGYGVFDASTVMTGNKNNNHFIAYQSRLSHTSSGNLYGTYGMAGMLVLNTHGGTGLLTHNYGLLVYDVAGTGSITNNYGLYIDNISRGTNKWSIYSNGGNSYHKGDFSIGSTLNYGTLTITADKTGFNSTGASQIQITGSTDTNKNFLIGFETTVNYAYLQTLARGSSFSSYPLTLQSLGGSVVVGSADPLGYKFRANGTGLFDTSITTPTINLTTGAAVNKIWQCTNATTGAGQWATLSQTWKGTWNATTNTPTLADGTGTSGDFYTVATAGTQNLGSGNITFAVNSTVNYNGTVWSMLPAPNITGAALTKTDDTNVTLTLGGSPSTALVNAASLTLGWTGTLSDARIASASNWNTAYSWGNHASAGYKLGSDSTNARSGYTTLYQNSLKASISHNHSGVYQPLATVLTNTTAAYTTALDSKLAGIAAGATAYTDAMADARIVAGITGKEPTISAGTTAQYWRGDKTWQTLPTTIGSWTTKRKLYGHYIDGSANMDSTITDTYVSSSSNWNTAYSDRMKWDGGSTGLVAATGRTSLGLVIGTDVLAYRTFGTAANSAATDFEVPLTFSNGVVRSVNAISADTTYVLKKTTAASMYQPKGSYVTGTPWTSVGYWYSSSHPTTISGYGITDIPTVNNATLTLATSGSGISGSQTFTANQGTAATFTVTSNATATNTASTIVLRDASGYVSLTGTFCSSDSTLKRNIKPFSKVDLYNASKIDFRKFLFKSETTGKEHFGVIAQDIKKLIPEVVSTNQNGKLEVNYPELLVIIAAQQAEEIKLLKEQNRQLERRIEKLENHNKWESKQIQFQ